jgi:hypothetical protein
VRTSYSHRVGLERWTELLNELAAGAPPA